MVIRGGGRGRGYIGGDESEEGSGERRGAVVLSALRERERESERAGERERGDKERRARREREERERRWGRGLMPPRW